MSERGVEDRSGTRQPLGKKKFWILDFEFWILDFGFWILDFGFWILDGRGRSGAGCGGHGEEDWLCQSSIVSSKIQHPKSNINSSQPCRFLLASSARVAIGSADFDEGLLV
jgi:hypothetical protein